MRRRIRERRRHPRRAARAISTPPGYVGAVPVPRQLPAAHPRRASTWSSPRCASLLWLARATTRAVRQRRVRCGRRWSLTVAAVISITSGWRMHVDETRGAGRRPAGRRLPGRPRVGAAGVARAAQPADVARAVLLDRGPPDAARAGARRRRRRHGGRSARRGQPGALERRALDFDAPCVRSKPRSLRSVELEWAAAPHLNTGGGEQARLCRRARGLRAGPRRAHLTELRPSGLEPSLRANAASARNPVSSSRGRRAPRRASRAGRAGGAAPCARARRGRR